MYRRILHQGNNDAPQHPNQNPPNQLIISPIDPTKIQASK